MKRKNHLMFYLTLLICAIMPLGFASFDVLAGETSQATPTLDDTVTKVCYNDTTNKQYTTIEMALKEANSGETIYVIPNPDGVSIYNDCVIKEGVTLNLPYSITYDASTNTYSNPISFASTSGSPGNLTYNSSYRKSLLYIEEGVTLTNNGTLYVGGIQTGGSGGLAFAGQTYQSFSEINVKKNAMIISNGKLTSYGYITGETSINSETNEVTMLSTIKLSASSETEIPFIVVEHRGGTAFTSMGAESTTDLLGYLATLALGGTVHAKLQTSPFNRFLFHNLLNINYEFVYGSTLIGKADLYANSQSNKADVSVIGTTSSFLLQLMSGSYVKGYIDNTVAEPKNHLNIYGNCKLNSMALEIGVQGGKVQLSTSDIHLPLSLYFDVTLNSTSSNNQCVVDLTSQKVKILPGCNFKINSGVIVNADSLVVYKNSDFYDSTGKYYITSSSCAEGKAYPSTTDGKLVCNGVLNTNSLGGIIFTEVESNESMINISSSNSVSMKEVSVAQSISEAATYVILNFTSQGKAIINNDVITSDLYTNTSYKSTFYNNEYVFYNYKIQYQNVGDSIDFSNYKITNPNGYFYTSSNIFYLENLTYEKVIAEASDIFFIGFYLDIGLTNEVSSFNNSVIEKYVSSDGVLTLYARWDLPKEGVTVIIKDAEGNTYSETDYDTTHINISNIPSNLTKENKYTISDNRETIIETSYIFAGWTIEGATFIDGTTGPINSNTLEIQANSGSIVTLNPYFIEIATTYYQMALSISLKSGSLFDPGSTNCSISFEECLQITDNGVLRYASQTVNYNTTNSVYFLKSGSDVTLSYNGYNLWPKEYVKIEFSGFNDNTSISESSNGESIRTLLGVASITVSY